MQRFFCNLLFVFVFVIHKIFFFSIVYRSRFCETKKKLCVSGTALLFRCHHVVGEVFFSWPDQPIYCEPFNSDVFYILFRKNNSWDEKIKIKNRTESNQIKQRRQRRRLRKKIDDKINGETRNAVQHTSASKEMRTYWKLQVKVVDFNFYFTFSPNHNIFTKWEKCLCVARAFIFLCSHRARSMQFILY